MTDERSDFSTVGTPRAGAGWGWLLGYGILSALLGAAAFLWPFAATYAATLVVGAFLMATGIASIAAGIATRGHEGRWYAIGFGFVSLIVGLIMAFEPMTGALSLTLLVVVWLGLRGAMELALGFRMRRGKGMMIALGVINILLALYVLATLPLSSLTLPGFILGISFLLGGINAIASALAHKKGVDAFAIPA
jgi:uncharacterized membrane protein HdeD (DUF308 family)